MQPARNVEIKACDADPEATLTSARARAVGAHEAGVLRQRDTYIPVPQRRLPCGGCRQRLAELAGPDTLVHLCGPDGVRRTVTLGVLLPLAFDAAAMA
jgi:cytidine deaminase